MDLVDPDSNYFSSGNEGCLIERERSDYFDVSAFNNYINLNENFYIVNYNFRSFSKNIDDFLSTFAVLPQIIVATETWFDRNSFFNIAGYHGFHAIRLDRRGGGVSIYIKDDLSAVKIPELCFVNSSIEVVATEVKLNNLNYIIFAIYRPHSDTVENFLLNLLPLLRLEKYRNCPTVVTGDFNVDLLSPNQSSENFKNEMSALHYIPLIYRPTRFDPGGCHNPSVLDQIWFNKLDPISSGIILHSTTDHLPTFIRIRKLEIGTNDKVRVQFRYFNSEGNHKFGSLLDAFDWNSIRSTDPHLYAENFEKKLLEFYNSAYPIKTKLVSQRNFGNPWMNNYTKKLINAKSQYFNLYRRGIVTKGENNAFKNKVNGILLRAKKFYYKNLFQSCQSNIKATWDNIKNLISPGGKGFSRQNIKLIVNGEELSSPEDVGCAFNEHFCSIGTQLANEMPESETDPLTFVPWCSNSFVLSTVMPSEVEKIISSLKNSKSNVNVSIRIVKEFKTRLSCVLADIVNLCFSKGIFPNKYKDAIGVPLHKKGAISNVLNFRLLSLLPVFGKVIEKCFNSRLIEFASENRLLSPAQFGFRRGFSTETAVNTFCEFIYRAMNEKLLTVNVFIDLRKAYDTINRSILLNKLERYGVRGVALNFVASFLSERTQRVKVAGILSDRLSIPVGLPTGSVLSCILFLFYVNDIPRISETFTSVMYADDTTLSFRGSSLEEVSFLCNEGLRDFYEWTVANKLSINVEKTNCMMISNQRCEPPSFFLNNIQIENVTNTKYLGVEIDNRMNFGLHISAIAAKVAKSIGVLHRLKNFLPGDALRICYYSLIYPYLNYCALVWGGACDSKLSPLEILQKKCIRIICGASYLAHTSPLFKQQNILKLKDIFRLKLGIFAYMRRGEFETMHGRNHNYNTRTRTNLLPEFQRLSRTQQSLNYRIPLIWNSIPSSIKNLDSKVRFKIAFKKYITNNY